MSDINPTFRMKTPEPPHSPYVREFFAANPDMNLKASLQFLETQYPDRDSWMLDSGVAVQILTGAREVVPIDIDVVCLNDEMESDFGHTNGL